MHLPSLHEVLVPPKNHMECIIHHHRIPWYSNVALLLIKEITLQHTKCNNGPMIMEFTGATMVSTILKQLV